MAADTEKSVLITGAEGLLGWHLRVVLEYSDGFRAIPLNREELNSDELLRSALEQADAVIHLAAQNRGDDEELLHNNVSLAKRLAEFIREQGRRIHVFHSSSIHIERFPESAYSRSKIEAAEILSSACDDVKGKFSNLVFPHLFGENGKPHYNSVVSTFCSELVEGKEPVVNQDGDLELLHCQDASGIIVERIEEGKGGEERVAGHPMKVSELKKRLETFWGDYRDGIMPELPDQIAVRLFNTLRSYCGAEQHTKRIEQHTDERGTLVEFVKEKTGGQVFYSSTRQGVTRGNHFHRHKIERFLVVQGEAEISMRRLFSDEMRTFSVTGESPQFVDIPTLWTHNITSTGEELLVCLFWVNEIFDPSNPDTYFETV